MTRGEFEKLTERYRLGNCTPEEIAFVKKWMEINGPSGGDDSFVFENEAEATQTQAEIWGSISRGAGFSETKSFWWARRRFWAGIAACFALVMAGGYFSQQKMGYPEILTGLETFNTSANRQRIILPDSSVVTLAEGASIVTSESYGQQTRTVSLNGEAFFEIRPNPQIPFLVYSGDLVTEVLGTSFTIKPEKGKKVIEVSVATGKVSVYSSEKDRNQRRRGVIITPNQKAVYDTESKSIRQDLVDNPRMVAANLPESAFNFDEMALRSVISTLQHSYGMEIVVSNPDLNDCVFTGNLSGFDLFRQLDYICSILGIRYEVRGTTVFLTGNGCEGAL